MQDSNISELKNNPYGIDNDKYDKMINEKMEKENKIKFKEEEK